MNHYAIRSGDETRSSFALAAPPMFSPVVSNNCRFLNHHNHHGMGGAGGGAVVCPKPRRVSLLNSSVNDPAILRRHLSHQAAEMRDSKAGAELLDLILTKGGGEAEIQRSSTTNNGKLTAASSPPFFSGSPPSRVSNPLIQDARFLQGPAAATPIVATTTATPWTPTTAASSPGGARKAGGCVRANFGNSPAVRIEGFNCNMDNRRDRNRNCSIPALA